MPRRDGKSLVIAFYPLELAAPLYGLFGGGINAAGGLIEVEGGFTHDAKNQKKHYRRLFQLHFKILTEAVV